MITVFQKLLAWYAARRCAGQTRMILYGLSDHTLRDIGLRREQIQDYSFFRR
jgi:uncharacterized protein YjiS (DUF1127 family)